MRRVSRCWRLYPYSVPPYLFWNSMRNPVETQPSLVTGYYRTKFPYIHRQHFQPFKTLRISRDYRSLSGISRTTPFVTSSPSPASVICRSPILHLMASDLQHRKRRGIVYPVSSILNYCGAVWNSPCGWSLICGKLHLKQ